MICSNCKCEEKIKTCYLCGHISDDVNSSIPLYVGGHGYVSFPVCKDRDACIDRMAKIIKEEPVNG